MLCGLPAHAFCRYDLPQSGKRRPEVRRNRCLRAHLDGLERAERNVRDQFSRGAGNQVQRRLPLMSPFGANEVAVEFLEELIAAVFERALGLLCYSVQPLVSPTRHSRSPNIARRGSHTLFP